MFAKRHLAILQMTFGIATAAAACSDTSEPSPSTRLVLFDGITLGEVLDTSTSSADSGQAFDASSDDSGSTGDSDAGEVSGPDVQWAAPSDGESFGSEGVRVIAEVSRMEDPTLLLFAEERVVLSSRSDRLDTTWVPDDLEAGPLFLELRAIGADGSWWSETREVRREPDCVDACDPRIAGVGGLSDGQLVCGRLLIDVELEHPALARSVALYANDELVGESFAAPYAVEWNTDDLSDGSYTLSARVYDEAGVTDEAAVEVDVVRFPCAMQPWIAILEPAPWHVSGGASIDVTVASRGPQASTIALFADGEPWNQSFGGLLSDTYVLSASNEVELRAALLSSDGEELASDVVHAGMRPVEAHLEIAGPRTERRVRREDRVLEVVPWLNYVPRHFATHLSFFVDGHGARINPQRPLEVEGEPLVTTSYAGDPIALPLSLLPDGRHQFTVFADSALFDESPGATFAIDLRTAPLFEVLEPLPWALIEDELVVRTRVESPSTAIEFGIEFRGEILVEERREFVDDVLMTEHRIPSDELPMYGEPELEIRVEDGSWSWSERVPVQFGEPLSPGSVTFCQDDYYDDCRESPAFPQVHTGWDWNVRVDVIAGVIRSTVLVYEWEPIASSENSSLVRVPMHRIASGGDGPRELTVQITMESGYEWSRDVQIELVGCDEDGDGLLRDRCVGTFRCHDYDEPEINHCGGCAEVEAVPGEPCGPCDTGRWACTGTDEVQCRGADLAALNVCGGCAAVVGTPSESCDECASGDCATACASTGEVSCYDTPPHRFVRVPAGSFEYGHRLTDGGAREEHVDHAFYISAYEMTLGEVEALGFRRYDELVSLGADHPAELQSFAWMEIANEMSRRDGLEACYELEGCEWTYAPLDCSWFCHNSISCDSVSVVSAVDGLYACSGYRLPTQVEWEYAARAGSTGSSWVDHARFGGRCNRDPLFGRIAVSHCFSAMHPEPPGTRLANPWGLYDILGNVAEYVWPMESSTSSEPIRDLDRSSLLPTRGGRYDDGVGRCIVWGEQRAGIGGARFVRTATEYLEVSP